ncbi:unnamed protein product [Ectocarpus sp. 8 AP-2014]
MNGDRYPKFCNDHRQANIINIRNQRCRAAGCSRGASFAATGGERGPFCSEHKGKQHGQHSQEEEPMHGSRVHQPRADLRDRWTAAPQVPRRTPRARLSSATLHPTNK